jgi:hypothetical protein
MSLGQFSKAKYPPSIKLKAAAELELRRRAAGINEVTPVWQPQDGPQRQAFESQADIIGYGGAAGGGKSDLALGMAGTQHRRSIIFRQVFPSLRGMIERSREIFNADTRPHQKDSYNESLHVWRLDGGRMIEFGAIQYEGDRKKHQGQPRDFMAFDEATEFPESTIRFIMGWNRTTTPGQHCQVLLTFNPPMDDAGEWVVRFFAPWLDAEHPNPAKDGELRYYAMIDTQDGPIEQEFVSVADVPAGITPKSRTFFHATLKDNPILAAQGYGATIDALPEPLRSLLKQRRRSIREMSIGTYRPNVFHRLGDAWSAFKGIPVQPGLLYPPQRQNGGGPMVWPGWEEYEKQAQNEGQRDLQRAKLAVTSPWVFADVQAIANEFSTAQLIIKERRGTKLEDVENHPLRADLGIAKRAHGALVRDRVLGVVVCAVSKAYLYWVPDA